MNTKKWAVLFVAMLSFDYATATYYGRYGGVHKSYANENEGYYGWDSGCRCNDDLTNILDGSLRNAKGHFRKYKDDFGLRDNSLEEYEFSDGQLRGLHKFNRHGPYRCSLSKKYVRIIFSIEFVELLIYYYVSFVEDFFETFLGGLFSILGRILGEVTDFLFRCVIPNVYVTVILYQPFSNDYQGGFHLDGLYLNNIDKISFRNKELANKENSLGPYFKPICDHALHNVFNNKVNHVFKEYFSDVRAKRDHFYYESNSGGNHERYGDDSSEYSKTQYEESDDGNEGYDDNNDNGGYYDNEGDD